MAKGLVNDIHPKFKRLNVYAVRDFPAGCGPLASRMRTSECDVVAMPTQNDSHVKKIRFLPSIPSSRSSNAAAAGTVPSRLNPPNPRRLKAYPVTRDFPAGCGRNSVSVLQENGNFRMKKNFKEFNGV